MAVQTLLPITSGYTYVSFLLVSVFFGENSCLVHYVFIHALTPNWAKIFIPTTAGGVTRLSYVIVVVFKYSTIMGRYNFLYIIHARVTNFQCFPIKNFM